MRQRLRTAGITLIITLASALILFGTPHLSQAYRNGIETLGTLFLVAVTFWYVRLTRELVKAQNETLKHNREAEERRQLEAMATLHRQTCVDVWRICITDNVNWQGLVRDLELLGSASDPAEAERRVASISKKLEKAEALPDALIAHAPNVPTEVEAEIFKCASFVIRAQTIGFALEVTWYASKVHHREDQRPTSVLLGEIWTLRHRQQFEGLEWDQVTNASFVTRAEQAIKDLEEIALRRVRAPNPEPSSS